MGGGTSWFWNRANPKSRRAVAIVGLVVAVVWFLSDLARSPIPGSIAVPAILIVFFGVQWRVAARRLTQNAAD